MEQRLFQDEIPVYCRICLKNGPVPSWTAYQDTSEDYTSSDEEFMPYTALVDQDGSEEESDSEDKSLELPYPLDMIIDTNEFRSIQMETTGDDTSEDGTWSDEECITFTPALVDQDGNEKESDSKQECLKLLCQLDMDQLRSILMETTEVKTHGMPGNGTTSSKSGFHIQRKALAEKCLDECDYFELLKSALLLLSKCKCGKSKQRQQLPDFPSSDGDYGRRSDDCHGDCSFAQRATEMERNLEEMKRKQDLFWQTSHAEVKKHVQDQMHTVQAEVKKHVQDQMHTVQAEVKKHVEMQMHTVQAEIKKHVQDQMYAVNAEVKKCVQMQMHTAQAEAKKCVQEQIDALLQTHMEEGLETQKEMHVEMASSLDVKIQSMKNRKRLAAWVESRPHQIGVLNKSMLSVSNASDSGSTCSAASVCSDSSDVARFHWAE